MKYKLVNAILLFVIIFIISILREVYIGKLISFGKPIMWEEIYLNLDTYFTTSFMAVIIYLMFGHKKEKELISVFKLSYCNI